VANESLLLLPHEISLAFFVVAYLTGSYSLAGSAITSLRNLRFDADVLMLTASWGAALLGQWPEGALLLFLFSLGHLGEHYALGQAQGAVTALTQMVPKVALVSEGGRLVEKAVDRLSVGEIVLARPGDRIPVDGQVKSGTSSVDQSAITGESFPITKIVGDPVFAGTLNLEDALELEVTHLAKDTTLEKIIRMVTEAQSHKGRSQRFAQTFTTRFVPYVLVAVATMMFLPASLGWLSWSEGFYRALLLLVAASPCALALGAPAAVLTGIAQAARHGVLIKGGAHLEKLGAVKIFAFDKTGTLTEGRFQLEQLEPIPGFTNDQLLRTAASVEQTSSHPIAQALLEEATARGLALPRVEESRYLPGLGIQGRIADHAAFIGSGRMVRTQMPQLWNETLADRIRQHEDGGKTVVVVGQANEVIGLLSLTDRLRPEAQAAVGLLRQQGVKQCLMLTGDNDNAARRVALEIGLTDVHASLLPEEKTTKLSQMARQGLVAMVGDGVNDAPALAAADVGIAMGGAGSDVAVEAADVVLLSDNLSHLVFALALSQASLRIIKQNLGLALVAMLVLMANSLTGVLPLAAAVAVHEGSTLLVIANALRLFQFSPQSLKNNPKQGH
jgi:Cd2+/Zn2+-exporting ATPase